MSEIKRLQKAIRDLHGLDAEHVEAVQVHEVFDGKTVWKGEVQVFRVRGHPTATHAYAWSYLGDAGEVRYLAALGVPPINSAQDAVKAAVMAHIEKAHREDARMGYRIEKAWEQENGKWKLSLQATEPDERGDEPSVIFVDKEFDSKADALAFGEQWISAQGKRGN